MRNIFLSYLLVLLTCSTINAQWLETGVGFQTIGIGNLIKANDSLNLVMRHYNFLNPLNPVRMVYDLSNDGGWTWMRDTLEPGGDYMPGIWFISSQNTMSVSYYSYSNYNNRLYQRTTDGGQTWTNLFPSFVTDTALSAGLPLIIDSVNGILFGLIIVVDFTARYGIFRTTDGGNTWSSIDTINPPAVWWDDYGEHSSYMCHFGMNIWVLTEKNYIFRSTNGGTTWNVLMTPISNWPGPTGRAVAFESPTTGLLNVSPTGPLFKTFNGGGTWTQLPFSGPLHYDIIAVKGTSNKYVSYDDDGCSFSLDGGMTWTEFPELAGVDIESLDFTDIGHGWAGTRTHDPTPGQSGIFIFTGILASLSEIDPGEVGFVISPNPCKGVLNIYLIGYQGENVAINLLNSYGELVFKTSVAQHATQSVHSFNLDNIPDGLYILVVGGGYKAHAQKVVIAGN